MRRSARSFLAVLLAVLMLAGMVPAALAEGPETAEEDGGYTPVEFSESGDEADAKLRLPAGDAGAAGTYAETDVVRVSVVLEDESVLEAGYPIKAISAEGPAAEYRQELEDRQSDVVEAIEEQVLGGEKLDVVWNLTLAANLISANVQYGKIRQIEGLDGVARVIVETPSRPQFTRREQTQPSMATSSDMIGSNQLWEAGYTGAGTRVAIIDTGIDPWHLSFDGDALMYSLGLQAQEKPEGWLESLDLLDEASLARILPELHIYKMLADNEWSVSDIYYSEKIPFAFNYGDISVEVDHEHDARGEHGSHVAGIAAANSYVPKDGGFVPALDEVKVQGVAPDAQILVMKVFGRSGAGYDSDYMAAIEDAFCLGADVVNLSLGTSQMGFSRSEYYSRLLEDLTGAGLVIAAAAGNEGSWAEAETGGYGTLRAEDVSLNTVSSPASYTDVLSVASSDNRGMTDRTVDVAGERFTFFDSGENYGLESVEAVKGANGYVMIDGIGTKEQFEALGDAVRGKLAVCLRGDISFSDKADNAMAAGAAGLIVVNTEDSLFGMDLTAHGDYTNPCIAVASKCGEAMMRHGEKKTAGDVDYYEGTLTFRTDYEVVEDVSPDAVSSFSAWGVPGSLELKPEITAPGGNIYSVNGAGDGHDGYENMSGTSMASPQIAGMTALLAQYIRENGLEDETGLNVGQLVNSLLMSTAVPIAVDGGDGVLYPVLQQGAGLANVALATQSPSYIWMDGEAASGADTGKVKAELGDDPGKSGVYTFGFTINDISGQALDYELRAELFTQELTTGEDGTARLGMSARRLMSTADFRVTGTGFTETAFSCDLDGDGDTDEGDARRILDYAAGNAGKPGPEADLNGDGEINTQDAYVLLVKLGSRTLTLEPGAKVHVTVTLTLDESAKDYLDKFPNGGYVEGYVFASPASTGEGLVLPEHSIPVLGFYGNWSDASMYDAPMLPDALSGTGEPSYMGINDPELITDPELGAAYASNYIGVRYFGDTEQTLWTVNPYVIEDTPKYGRAAINSRSLIYSMMFSLIRNAAQITLFVKDGDGNVVDYQELSGQYPGGFPYTEDNGTVVWGSVVAGLSQIIAAPSGMGFSEGERFTVGVICVPEYYENGGELTAEEVLAMAQDGTLGRGTEMSWTFTVDDTAPSAVSMTVDGDGNLTVDVEDNLAVAAVVLMNAGGTQALDAATVEQTAGAGSVTFDLSGVSGSACKVLVGDYAGNETLYDVTLTGEDEPEEDYTGQMFGFSTNANYGQTDAWVRFDPETLNWYNRVGAEVVAQSPITVTAAEYVGGYVYMAGNNGNLYVARQGHWADPVLLGSYTETTELIRDMAYSRKDGALYALGTGNRIFKVDLSTGALTLDHTVEIVNPAEEADDNNAILVTLAVDDDGNFYSVNSGYKVSGGIGGGMVGGGGIGGSIGGGGVSGGQPDRTFLYSWSGEDVEEGRVAQLEPVSESNVGNYYSSHIYGAQNVFQSMAWDHDADVLYWASGDMSRLTEHRIVVFKNPGEDGRAELLRADEPNSGLSMSQIPGLYIVPETDTTTVPEAQGATAVTLSRGEIELLVGATVTLTANVAPWNLADKSVVWTSDNGAVATVSGGVVRAIGAGTATVTAASAVSGEVKASCTVTVKEIPDIAFTALLTKPDGTSVWVDAATGDLGSWSELARSDSYIAGTLLDDTIYVHDGNRLYAVDADSFTVRPLTPIDITWNWSDAAPAPLGTLGEDTVLVGQDTAFGRIVGLVDGIDGGTSIAVMNPELGTGDDMGTRQQFYYDRAVVIAYSGSGVYYDDYYYRDCPARYYYIMTESGELWLAEIFETYDGWSTETLVHDVILTDIGPTGIDLRGVSAIYGGQSASMLYDEDSGYLLVSACMDGVNNTVYVVDPGEAIAVELGTFGAGNAPVVALYQYERISELTVKVRAESTVIYAGETTRLTASVYPADRSGTVTWTSSDSDVASVDENGVVTGHSAGTAVITAAFEGASASCTVTVKALATAPVAYVYAYAVTSDGTGEWVYIDLSTVHAMDIARDNRHYTGAAAYDGKLYGANGIWLNQIDPYYDYTVNIGEAVSEGWLMLDGTGAYGETVTLNYLDEEYLQHSQEVQVPGGVVYVSDGERLVFVDDYKNTETIHGQQFLGYSPAALTWLGNRISPMWEGPEQYEEDNYIQEWIMLGSDGYLWKLLRRTYVNELGEVVTSPVSDPEEIADLGIEFADRTKLSMTRVKGDGYDGLLISDAATPGGVTLYWVDLEVDGTYVQASEISKLGVLEGISDIAGLYTFTELNGEFVNTSTTPGGGEGGDEEGDYYQGYEDGSMAVYGYYVPLEYEDIFNEGYISGYNDGYEEGSWADYGLFADGDYGIETTAIFYDGGYEEGFMDGIYDAAYEIGWSRGEADALEGREPDPTPPDDIYAYFLDSAPAGMVPMSVGGGYEGGTVLPVGGDVTVDGSVSGTSVTVGLEVSASTNGLVTLKYDPALLSFGGVSEATGRAVLAWRNDASAGTVVIAYASSGAFTGRLNVSFFSGMGRPETETEISLSASELGGTVYGGAADKGLVELRLPYVPVPVTPPAVTTDDVEADDGTVTETTAKPGVTVKDGEASATVSDSVGSAMVDQAKANGSDTVVVAPAITAEVDSASVTVPGKTVTEIGESTGADLRVETPVADVTLSNGSLAELGGAGDVTVRTERGEDTVTVEITAGGESLPQVPGGVKASFELGEGQVAVLVSEDGTETVITKSLVEDGTAYVLLDGTATVKIIDNSAEFEDVDSGSWYEDAVAFASSHELFNGVSETAFAPDADMSRSMLATVLWRLESEAESSGTFTFPDVAEGEWFTEGVAWAAEQGIVKGYTDGTFEPEAGVSRQEMAVMIYRYALAAGLDTAVSGEPDFADFGLVADWAKDAMSWAVSAGLIRGGSNGLIDPTGPSTRAQVATIIERLVALIVK